MDAEILKGLVSGDAEAIAELAELISKVSLHQDGITGIWIGLIQGMRHAWVTGKAHTRSMLVEFALELGQIRQDDDTLERYGDLALIYGFPNSNEASAATGRTAARVAKLSREHAKDAERYLGLAMDALLIMLDEGETDCRMFAATGLAYLPDSQVRMKLIAMAQEAPNDELKEAAGESVGLMRTMIEMNLAKSDRDLLLDVEYPDPNDPRRECLEQMLDAAITVLEANGNGQDGDYAAAVRQLAVFGGVPEDVSVAFYGRRDRQLLARAMGHAENALLRALVKAKDESAREDAAQGLEAIGSERVEHVLERIAARHGEGCQVGRLASETLAKIRGNGLEIISSAPLPPEPKTKKITNPRQALKVRM